MFRSRFVIASAAAIASFAGVASGQEAAISSTSSSGTERKNKKIDYKGAKTFELPIAQSYSTEDLNKSITKALSSNKDPNEKIPGSAPGYVGSGVKSLKPLGKPIESGEPPLANLDVGTANLPFSTARADLAPRATNEQYPYRAAGKLFFNVGAKSYICSASLIKRGLVVTAAHCVANFGKNAYYSDWEFVPGYRNGDAPFGAWTVAKVYVLTSYLDGSDICQLTGVVCKDDIAILALNQRKTANRKPAYAGDSTGWLSYAWDKVGFAGSITHITQLGYPGCLDNAALMERNDSQGTIDSAHNNNTVIGSLMCGGSSGGPWIINFGMQPLLTGTTLGASPGPNQVVGVTSWGSTSNAVKWMGASPFLSTNVVPLVAAACKAYPEACKP